VPALPAPGSQVVPYDAAPPEQRADIERVLGELNIQDSNSILFFGTSAQEEVRELDVRAAEALLPELATGSMGPKLESALAFARTTGHNALITSAAVLAEALAGRAGTRIRP